MIKAHLSTSSKGKETKGTTMWLMSDFRPLSNIQHFGSYRN